MCPTTVQRPKANDNFMVAKWTLLVTSLWNDSSDEVWGRNASFLMSLHNSLLVTINASSLCGLLPGLSHCLGSRGPCMQELNGLPWPVWMLVMCRKIDSHFAITRSLSPWLDEATQQQWLDMDWAHSMAWKKGFPYITNSLLMFHLWCLASCTYSPAQTWELSLEIN